MWYVTVENPAPFDGPTMLFIGLLVIVFWVLVLFLIIKYAVLGALRINRDEAERERRRA